MSDDPSGKGMLDYITAKFEQLSASLVKLQNQREQSINAAGSSNVDKLEKMFQKLNDSIVLQSNNLKDVSKYGIPTTLYFLKFSDNEHSIS